MKAVIYITMPIHRVLITAGIPSRLKSPKTLRADAKRVDRITLAHRIMSHHWFRIPYTDIYAVSHRNQATDRVDQVY